jgi:Cytochrome c7 and related cytochrome c
MLPITRTEFGDKLKELGLDVRNLPPLAKMDPMKRRLVMDYVSEATGADCTDCHASEEDLKAMTPRKLVARHMWDDWTRGFTTADGGPVFCDSCHHGALTILDRRDTKKVGEWMKTSLVPKLARKDKKKVVCEQCHGEPFDSNFLEKWRSPHP